MKKVAHKREQHAKGLGLKQPNPLALKLNHDDPAERSKRDTWMMRENKIPFGERDGTLFRALKSRMVFAATAFAQVAGNLGKQEICCSRSFGKRLRSIEPIQEAVTAYTTRAAEKLRQQDSLCHQLRISLRTGMLNPNETKYWITNGLLCQLPYPTDDTRLIIAAAREGISRLYRDGFSYAKAQVLLLDLCRRDEYTQDLFAPEQPVKTERLMSALDAINRRWGRGTLQPGRLPSTDIPQSSLTQAACTHRLQAQVLIVLDQVLHREVRMGPYWLIIPLDLANA